jgi:hypothetical protein
MMHERKPFIDYLLCAAAIVTVVAVMAFARADFRLERAGAGTAVALWGADAPVRRDSTR